MNVVIFIGLSRQLIGWAWCDGQRNAKQISSLFFSQRSLKRHSEIKLNMNFTAFSHILLWL